MGEGQTVLPSGVAPAPLVLCPHFLIRHHDHIIRRASVRPTEPSGGPMSSHPEMSEFWEQQALGTLEVGLGNNFLAPSLPQCSSRAGIGLR